MVDPWDDMALAKAPFKVVACMPVRGRRPLLKLTIQRLYRKNGVYKVICSGDNIEDKKVCEAAGAAWVTYPNTPLGAKWNAAFIKAKEYNPDACLFVGSSDWISDNWITELRPLLSQFDMIGTYGCHFIHLGNDGNRLCYWPGYTNGRKGESIGIGRLLSRQLIDRLQFKPFEDRLPNSLDHSMQVRCTLHAGRSHVVSNNLIKSVSISTDLWDNKHKFDDHWSNRLPSIKIAEVDHWIQNNFPEAKTLCESLKDTSVSR
jgi:hypothetical protein